MRHLGDAWGGDINIGEQPETEALAEQTAPRRDYTEYNAPDPPEYHNWVMINGHIVMDSERSPEDLVDDHGFKNLDKALAYGRVAVTHRWSANFQILHSNVGLTLVLKKLKSYAKEQGWNDLAFVDHNGEELRMERTAMAKDAMALRPDDMEAWMKENGPYLVHYTKPENVESIMQQGIKPWSNPMDGYTEEEDAWGNPVGEPEFDDGPTANWSGFAETRPGHVYMATPDNRDIFGMQNSKGEAPFQHPIHVDMRKLDPSKFKADEDWASANWHKYYPEEEDDWLDEAPPNARDWEAGSETLGEWAERHGLEDEDWTHDSLKGMADAYGGGSVAYEGEIPPHALVNFHDPNTDQRGKQPAAYSQFLDQWKAEQGNPAYQDYLPQGHLFQFNEGDYKYAALDGVGESNPDKAWVNSDENPNTDIQDGQFYMNPAGDAPKSALYECPHCGLELENYTDFRTHLMGEKDALTAPNDAPDVAPIDHDKVMPADWNNSTTPDWIGIQSKVAAPKVTIPGPIPFIYDIEDDRVYVGHPGDEIQELKNAGDYNPLGIVEGLYKPTGEVVIKTQTNMPYTIRHMIQLWYYMHPELEVKSVIMEWEDGGTQKLAMAMHGMALRQRDLDAWMAHNGPYMVHWTREENIPSIMEKGLHPHTAPYNPPEDDDDQSWPFDEQELYANWGGYEATRPNHVYLAHPGNQYMHGNMDDHKREIYQRPIFVDMRKLDLSKLKADEDKALNYWPAWTHREKNNPDGDQEHMVLNQPPTWTDWKQDGAPALGDWADQMGLDNEDWTFDSLKGSPLDQYSGTIAHEGPIHPSALSTRIPQQTPALARVTASWYAGRMAAAPDDVGEKVRNLLKADPSAVEVYDALSPLGNVYVVGGAIRDLALGRIPKDIDIMAQGIEPDDAIKALKLRPGHVEVTGNQFPVIRYFHPSGYQCEVALPRREQSTGGGRKQDFDVQMDVHMPVEEDLERRDFTANSMAVDLKTGQLIDPYNGWEHTEVGRLKMVHPNAFQDDATRILRALSSRSRHGLQPDVETMQAMEQWAHRIDTHVPAEQKSAELEKLLSGDDPASAIELAQMTGVLKHLIPELDETVGFDQKSKYHDKLLFDHIMEVVRTVSEITKDPDVRLAALLHDIGKPGSQWFDDAGYGHYYRKHFKEDELDADGLRKEPIGLDHEHHGADLARDRLKELAYGNKDRQKRVEHLVRHHMFAPFSDEKGARKFVNKVEGIDHARDLVDIRQGDAGSKALPWDGDEGKMRSLLDTVQQQGQATDLSGLALNGQDVMQILGIKPSKEVGEHLQRLQEIVLEDPSMNNRETLTEALTMKQAARRVLAKEFDGWCWALLPEEAPVEDAPDADNAHVTLAMVKGMDGLDRATAASIADAVTVPITAKITGCTAFPEGDDGQPIVLIISAPEIDRAREIVTERLDEVDADYSSDYGFIPHITLGYARDDDEVAKLTDEGDALIGNEIVFDRSVYSGGDGVWKTPGHKRAKFGNILDPVQETLDPDVFDNADKAKPKVKPTVVEWIRVQVDGLLKGNGWEHLISHTHLVMTGSLTSYQWSHKSDFDVSVWFDYPKFPNLVRADMIGLMVSELDGTIVPGTTHELQCYIVPDDVTPDELYKPGLRSAYDLDKNKWMVAPERDRVFNPYTEVPALMGWVHDQAEKLKLLKNYDEPLYKEFLHQIHTRRQRDQKAGKGDFSESNIVWKYIEHMGLT